MASPFRVYWSQVHPVFMVAAIGATVVGGLYSPIANLGNLTIFCVCVFAALYFAHVRDSYVDFFERGEDRFSYMTKQQAKRAMLACTLAVVACGAYFALQGLWLAVGVVFAGLLLAFFHTPMDLNPIGATAGYPTGLALAAIGGFYVQAGAVSNKIVFFAAAVWLVLNGVKIVDDIKDFEWDRKFGKIAAPVYFGKKKAKKVAVALVFAGATLGLLLSLAGVLPVFSAIAFLPLYPAGYLSLYRNDRKSLFGLDAMLWGTYAFTAIQLIGLALRLP
jgi:1,4-dihydroxy-2-naphthoate octaprenyltransferase